MTDLDALYAQAAQHHAAGRMAEAESGYRAILAAEPIHALALHGLGLVALGSNHLGPGLALMERAAVLDPDNLRVLVDLGVARAMNGKQEEAAVALRQAVALAPDNLSARYNFGLLLFRSGSYDAAIAELTHVTDREPKHSGAWMNLGLARMRSGDPAAALKCLARCVELEPYDGGARLNYANLLLETGDVDGAIREYRPLLGEEPRHYIAHFNFANALKQSGDIDGAIASYRRALSLKSDDVDTLNNLGTTLYARADKDEALAALYKAVALAPDNVHLHYNLAKTLVGFDEWDAAEVCFQDAIRLDPAYLAAQTELATLLKNTGRVAEAIDLYRAVLARDPDYDIARSSLLMALNYRSDDDNAEIFRESIAAMARAPRPELSGQCYANARVPERPLRVGYVSADFRTHSVSFFVEPLLRAHNRSAVEAVCYSDTGTPDAVTARLRAGAALWRPIIDLSDARVAEMVRADGIDILVDLAGHTAGNRLALFAGKVAPIQVSWLGYPNTVGLTAIDYRLTDAIADPDGIADTHHVEKLVRLPHGFLCYQAPADAPEPAESPSLTAGHVTFGSFNNLPKLSPQTIAAWSALLAAVPGSRLVLKSASLSTAATAARIRAAFAALGVSGDRIDLLGHAESPAEHLAQYARIDIALDPFPYNGTTTSCEALWMGVPIITLRGHRHAARVGASILTQVGLGACIAEDSASYVTLARDLATDPACLAGLRAGLRERIAASRLCDAPAFARDVEAAYRTMWRTWCAGG